MVEVKDSDHFVARLLRGAGRLPGHRYEMFLRLYVHGQSAQEVQKSLGLSEQQMEAERSAMLRALMRMH